MPAGDGQINWAIDPVHTRVRFDARYLLITDVSGWFRELEGGVICKSNGFDGCEINLVIYTASLFTGVEERDRHLRSADFFDTNRYPQIRFHSTDVTVNGDDLEVTGLLTIKNIETEITFSAKHKGTVADPMGNTKAGFESDIIFDRKTFNITWNQFFDSNGILISDEVKLRVDMQLLQV